MQTTEHDEQQRQATSADPHSQPLPPASIAQAIEDDDDPDAIFIRAVAEIDTQPLNIKREPFTIGGMLEIGFLVGVLLFGLVGSMYLAITYPHTLVVLFTKAKPASITATLDVSTRTLPPVTLTRSATTATTGQGHRDARAATGMLIFYNGSATPQYVPIGSVFTGNDAVQVTTEQSITVPAANLPTIGSMPVVAHALLPGSQGNIAAFDVDVALSPVLKVKNEAPFTNGRDARDYKAVASQDLQTLTSTVNKAVRQAFTTAFPLQQEEQAIPTQCLTTTTPNHQTGQEAQSVTLTASQTCSALVYNSQELYRQALRAFTQTKPGANYRIVSSVRTCLKSVSPFIVTISGKWVYTFSQDYEQLLAQQIEGDMPAQAQKVLLQTGVISYASIPNTLPSAMYINFLVLAA